MQEREDRDEGRAVRQLRDELIAVVIERPVADVFAFISDLDHAPEWAPQMGPVDRTGPLAPGVTFREQRRFLGRSGTAHWAVYRFIAQREMGLTLRFGPMRGEFVYHFEPVTPTTTRVSQDIDLRFVGPLALLSGILAAEARREEGRELVRLKSLLETY